MKTKNKIGILGGLAVIIAAVFVGPHEGRNLTAYYDPVGIPTICEGWTHGVKMGDTATDEQCDELTIRALQDAWQVFDAHVPDNVIDDMTPHSIAAFLSFIYNVGPGGKNIKDGFVTLKNGRQSTMLTLLKSGDVTGACHELSKWTRAGGKQLRGLEIRRAAELEYCLRGQA